MSFVTMKKSLIKQGLLTTNGELTSEGHAYVEAVKQELKDKALKQEQWLDEKIDDVLFGKFNNPNWPRKRMK